MYNVTPLSLFSLFSFHILSSIFVLLAITSSQAMPCHAMPCHDDETGTGDDAMT
jgi:hypothetical protein